MPIGARDRGKDERRIGGVHGRRGKSGGDGFCSGEEIGGGNGEENELKCL